MALVARIRLPLLILLACVPALVGCASPATPEAAVSLRIAAAPAMRPAADALAAAYRAEERYATVEVSEGLAGEVLAAVASGKADLALVEERTEDASLLVDPDSSRRRIRHWPLAVAQVAVIVHPSNPIGDLTTEELCRIYEGLARRWEALGGADEPIRLVSREPGAPARLAFDRAILQESRIAGTAVIMPGDRAVVDYVAEQPGGIGYISSAWAGEGVKVIALEGALPGATDGRYPLTHPVYLVTAGSPASEVSAFLRFCRSEPGRDALARLYASNGR